MAEDRPRIFFFGVFEKFETFLSKICADSERYRNILAGIFEIITFNGNIAFPLSPVLQYLPREPTAQVAVRSATYGRGRTIRVQHHDTWKCMLFLVY